MTDQDPVNSNSVEADSDETLSEVDSRPSMRSHRGAVLWYTSPLAVIVLAVVAFGCYFSYTGIDMAWALGTSGWVTPPGTRLAGKEIGGKSFDEITSTLDRLSGEFAGLSVWLVESPLVLSVVSGEFELSTVGDEVALSVAPGEFGLLLDVQSMRREIASLNDTSGALWAIDERIRLWNEPPDLPARIAVDEEKVREFLETVKSTVDCEPVDALLDLANYMVRSASDGIIVDVESTFSNIPTVLEELVDFPIELVLTRTEPSITNEDFAGFDLENPLAAYTTHFATWKRNRSRNISMVAAHFEGVVIGPGEVFSFNETTGPRTSAEGYLLAPMYRDRRVELSPAGGACQVSTTLYNTALLAGLEIVERYPHSRPCSYVPYGRDATVAYESSVDLRFRNSLDHPIILHQEVDYLSAGTITFVFFGHPDDRVNVEIGNAYSWIGRSDSMTTYIVDMSLAPGEEVVEDSGVSGIHQRAWRTWFDEEGNELWVEELSNDRVRPVGALIRYNPAGGAGAGEVGRVESPSPPPPDKPGEDEIPPGVF